MQANEAVLGDQLPANEGNLNLDELFIHIPIDIPPPDLAGHEQQEPAMAGLATLAKNFPVFAGKKSEDADIHVNRFEHY